MGLLDRRSGCVENKGDTFLRKWISIVFDVHLLGEQTWAWYLVISENVGSWFISWKPPSPMPRLPVSGVITTTGLQGAYVNFLIALFYIIILLDIRKHLPVCPKRSSNASDEVGDTRTILSDADPRFACGS